MIEADRKTQMQRKVIEPLLNEQQLATWLGISKRTLQLWRQTGQGPPYLLLGRLVRYRNSDVSTWLGGRVLSSTSQGVRR
jgi:predicted DNA-binding transcriptional regulator AlpA